jgi:hypothetical protein
MISSQVKYDGYESICYNDPQYGGIEISGINHVIVNNAEIEYHDAPTMQVEKGE